MQTCPHCDHQFPTSEGTVDPSAPDVIGCPECGRTAPLSDSSLETVALDDADGKNDGTIKGQQYFECEPKHGVMVREADVDVLVSA